MSKRAFVLYIPYQKNKTLYPLLLPFILSGKKKDINSRLL